MDGTPSRGVAICLSALCYGNGDKLMFTWVSLEKIIDGEPTARAREKNVASPLADTPLPKCSLN